MNEKRVKVWIQADTDRPYPRLMWFDPETGNRKSESVKTTDAKELEAARRDKEYELSHGLHVEPSRMSWEKFRRRYEDEKTAFDSKNAALKAAYVLDWFEKAAKPTTMGKIDERTIARFQKRLRDEGMKAATIAGYLAYLKSALGWARDQGIIPKVPTFTMPRVPKGTNRVKIDTAARITTEEFERLLMKAPNGGWKLLIAFAWHCGMRRHEARNVRGVDVDLTNHKIRIPENKAKDAAATALITPDLHRLLVEMFPDGMPAGKLIADRDVPADPRAVTHPFSKIAKAAAVKGNSVGGVCTLHDLRRSYGSRWAEKVPAQVLQRLMRHSHIKTTLEFYADTEQAALRLLWGGQD